MKFSQEIIQEIGNLPNNPKNSNFFSQKIKEGSFNTNSSFTEIRHNTTPENMQKAINVELHTDFRPLEVIDETQNFCESEKSTKGEHTKIRRDQLVSGNKKTTIDFSKKNNKDQEQIEKRLSFNFEEESEVFLSQTRLSINPKKSHSASKNATKDQEKRITFDNMEIQQLQDEMSKKNSLPIQESLQQDTGDNNEVIDIETPVKKVAKGQFMSASSKKTDVYQHVDTPQLSKRLNNSSQSKFHSGQLNHIEYEDRVTNDLHREESQFNSQNSLLQKMKEFGRDNENSLRFITESKKVNDQVDMQINERGTEDFFISEKYPKFNQTSSKDRPRNWDSVTQLQKKQKMAKQNIVYEDHPSEFQSKEFKSEDLHLGKKHSPNYNGIEIDAKNTLDSTNPFLSPMTEIHHQIYCSPQQVEEYVDHDHAYIANFNNQNLQNNESQSELSHYTNSSQLVFNHMVYKIHDRNKQIEEVKAKNKIL